jgi:hypothetical protein
MGKSKVLFLILFIANCTASRYDTIKTDTIRATIDTETQIPERTRVLLGSQLDDLDQRLKESDIAYEQLQKRYDNLLVDYNEVRESYAKSQRDAGFKDTVKFQTTAIGGLILAGLLGFVLFLVYKGKVRIPGVLG